MYSKLALRNVKRSFKDYTLYFFTLVLGICIFYMFNSIESQKVMFSLSSEYERVFKIIDDTMNIISYFVAFILGFLIIYANKFLITRRKKELGIYMTLGMNSRKISRLLFLETLFIGIISLIIGLLIGIFLSQGLSVITSKMFNLKLINFKFIFSKSACIKTCKCFGIMYMIILVFNSLSIKKFKLQELLKASKKNEELKIKSSISSIIFFIISVVCIGRAYYMAINDNFAVISIKIVIAVILGCIGTFCFFFSLSGFLLRFAKCNKKFYFRDLNMFILKSINSKINTTFISMTFICLMLFLSVCMLSTGIGLNTSINKQIKDNVRYDATFNNLNGEQVEDILKQNNIDLQQYCSNVVGYNLYYYDFGYYDLFNKYVSEREMSYYPIYVNEKMPIMKLSDFNNILKMLNEDTINLEENEYLLFNDTNAINNCINDFIKEKKTIFINGKELICGKNEILSVNINNNSIKNNMCTIVVSDYIVTSFNFKTSFVNVNFKDNMEEELSSKIKSLSKETRQQIYYMNKDVVYAESFKLGAQIAYISIYLGFIFVITCAATLAIQMLCECDDNIERYKIIKKIGVDEKMINKSLFIQIGIYFMVPFSLAVIHSIIGIKICSRLVSLFTDGTPITSYIILTTIMCLIIYGGYFFTTYLGTKRMVKKYS